MSTEKVIEMGIQKIDELRDEIGSAQLVVIGLREACNELETTNAALVEALEGLCAVVGKMKPASGEPYGRAVAELIEARIALKLAKGE